MTNQVQYDFSRTIDSENDVIREVLYELLIARKRYPSWPSDLIHAMVVVQEESGEILKAANEVYWDHKDTTIEDVRKEVIQTMAMCLRLLTETPGLATGTEMAEAEPILDWERAYDHLRKVTSQYIETSNIPGVNTSFALTYTLVPLKYRYETGERTKELYDAMMEVE